MDSDALAEVVYRSLADWGRAVALRCLSVAPDLYGPDATQFAPVHAEAARRSVVPLHEHLKSIDVKDPAAEGDAVTDAFHFVALRRTP
jgi:hypothetical protein